MDKLHSLAWRQPFGTAMLHGKIETRRYHTNVRGPVLIYTTKKRYEISEIESICGNRDAVNVLMIIHATDPTHDLNGYAIAIGNLVDSLPMIKPDEQKALVEYRPELWSWIFEDVRRIEPFKYKVKLPHSDIMVSAGGQGWGWVPDELMSKIKYI